jgi:hypothetical protein
MMNKQNKYQEGETVYALMKPEEELIIRRYIDSIYYCKVKKYPERKELVFFERELAKTTAE